MTPTFNSLAARGVVLDQCFLDSCSLPEMLLSLWSAQHALNARDSSAESLWQLALAAGLPGILVTDCFEAATLAEKLGCQQVVLLKSAPVHAPASDSSECCIMALFTEAASLIEEITSDNTEKPFLLWIHSRGLKLPWDAPVSLRQRFADPQDPEPPGQVQPPNIEINSKTDPDWIIGWGQVAAAQAAVIDQAVELLVDCLDESAVLCSWCLVGLDGVPLGEHGWIGWGKPQLYGEQLQVPVLIVPSPHLPVGVRRHELCQLPDVSATIAELCGLQWSNKVWGISQLEFQDNDIPRNWLPGQQTIGLKLGDRCWIRVPAWSLAFDDYQQNQLFVKPEDRWEASEISVRCVDIVSELREHAKVFYQAALAGTRNDLPALGDSLCNLLR